MSRGTAIEWADHTFNPWWGCSRVSPGCRLCYAERAASRYGHQVWGQSAPRRLLSDDAWRAPLRWNRDAQRAGVPARVFCASMADVFEDHPAVTAARQRLWGLVEATPWLCWQLLTKRPENAAAMVPWGGSQGGSWPAHVWLGTSVETQRYADERVPALLAVPGVAVRFLSCEPLLGPLDLSPWLPPPPTTPPSVPGARPLVGWVIAGGESGSSRARPVHPDWVRALRDQAIAAGVPFLFKQWGHWVPEAQNPAALRANAAGRAHYVELDGSTRAAFGARGDAAIVQPLGKKAAGRRLDGLTWDEFPRLEAEATEATEAIGAPTGQVSA